MARKLGRFTETQVVQIRTLYAQGGHSFCSLGRRYQCSGALIASIVSGECYKKVAGPLHCPRGRASPGDWGS